MANSLSTLRGVTIILVASLLAFSSSAMACTGITLKGSDGTIVFARTLEWGTFDLQGDFLVIPRGTALKATPMPDDRAGIGWTAKYGVAGASGIKKLILADAVNEHGLTIGMFYLPGFTEYQPYDPKTADISMASVDVPMYLASQFRTLDEVRAGLEKVRVVPVVEKIIGIVPPVHYIVTDPSGKSAVIQYIKGELTFFDAPLGVVTNSPNYDWHILNLNNYLNLSAVGLSPVAASGLKFAPLGAGSGMIGLPGDFTPPSRFVRAVAFTQTARKTKGGYDTVREAFRILDNFNVPAAAAEGSAGQSHGDDLIYSATQWTIATDIKNMRVYYHTQFNRNVRMVDLNTIDFGDTAAGIKRIPLDESREPAIKEVKSFSK
ncbi:MAG: choloylglycine hydrolase family protein [Hyphomicrobiaceae bacterium]|nr:choloylglycine hydrolase family protein [Hyphomicrobiaceae bacterium]